MDKEKLDIVIARIRAKMTKNTNDAKKATSKKDYDTALVLWGENIGLQTAVCYITEEIAKGYVDLAQKI